MPIPSSPRLKRSIDALLAGAALVLCAIIGGFFIWVTSMVAGNVSEAIAPAKAKSGSIQFNIDGAKQLDYRGLTQ